MCVLVSTIWLTIRGAPQVKVRRGKPLSGQPLSYGGEEIVTPRDVAEALAAIYSNTRMSKPTATTRSLKTVRACLCMSVKQACRHHYVLYIFPTS